MLNAPKGSISQDTVNKVFLMLIGNYNEEMLFYRKEQILTTVKWFLERSPRKPDQNTVDMAFSQDAVNQKFINNVATRYNVTRTEWFLTRSPIKPDQNAVNTAFIASAEAGNLETLKWFLERSPITPTQNAVNTAYINVFYASKEKNKSTPSSIQLGQTLNIKEKVFLYMTNGDHLKIRPDHATLSNVVSELYMESVNNK